MNGTSKDGCMSMLASVIGGALLGVVATTLWWMRQARRSRKYVGHSDKKIKVYHTPTFRSARVAWMIAELGAEDEYELVSYNPYLSSDDERQWYVDSVHPHGTVPAMVDNTMGQRVMLESGAICMHLAERYGRLLPQLDMMPDYLDWCVYAVATVDRHLSTIDEQLQLDVTQQDSKKLEEAFAAADKFARLLEKQLNKRSFICGSALTAADVVVGYCVMWSSVIKGGRIIYDYPNIKAYLAKLKSRPKFAKMMGTARDWVNSDSEYVRGKSSN